MIGRVLQLVTYGDVLEQRLLVILMEMKGSMRKYKHFSVWDHVEISTVLRTVEVSVYRVEYVHEDIKDEFFDLVESIPDWKLTKLLRILVHLAATYS